MGNHLSLLIFHTCLRSGQPVVDANACAGGAGQEPARRPRQEEVAAGTVRETLCF